MFNMEEDNQKVEYVSFGHEVYKNMFSGLLFKLQENSEGEIKHCDKYLKNINILIRENNLSIDNSNENNIIETDNINKNEREDKISDPNNYPELQIDDGSLVFAINGFNDENILRTANELNNALNKENDKVDINTFLEVYRLFAEFRWALSCRLKSELNSKENILENKNNEIITTSISEEIGNEKEINKQANDIYNYHKYFCNNKLDEYEWPWWQIILWLLFIIPGLIHEIWRRCKIAQLDGYISEMEKKSDLFFAIERQLAFLQANEVFFKNMILKANDPKFLEKMRGKSINTFLRENNNLVNSVNNEEDKKSNNGDKIYEKVVPKVTGGMKNTRQININGKVYFTKKGKMFLDKKTDIDLEQRMEEYRGNLDKENSLENRNNLIDTASHGCIMKAFDNILGLNVLVDTKLIVTQDGYDVFMKSADGKNAGDIFWYEVFRTDERYIDFIKGLKRNIRNYNKMKKERLQKLEENPLPSKLQDAMMKINFLDYLCSNRDRYSANFFVWKDGLCGIDNEFAFFTGTDWNEYAWALCVKEDLPNLIPYATQEFYNIAKSFLQGDGLEELINIYMIFVKTLNEKNLLQGTKNIRQRAKELLDHFEWLQSNDGILKDTNDFNAKTGKEITEKSLVLNKAKQYTVNTAVKKNVLINHQLIQ